MQLQNGTLLQGGKYKIETVLGQGGFDASVDNWGDETNIVIPA